MHEKHRERMRDKVAENIDSLHEHEILEVLLFYALPRVNTNPIAHELITAFGSINNVLSKDVKELTQIKGVGYSTAVYLNTLGCVFNKYYDKDKKLGKDETVYTYQNIGELAYKSFIGIDEEIFIAFFLDSKQRLIGKKIINDHKKNLVEIDLGEFSKQVVSTNPKFVVIAHNHLSGICSPTFEDDIATEKLCLVLGLYGVNLVDHIIVSGNETFSYYYTNRLDDIKKKVSQKL